jgi:hypothetical protein
MDHIFIHTTFSGLGPSAKLKEIAAVRTDEKGAVLTSRNEVIDQSTENSYTFPVHIALKSIRQAMLDREDKYVVVMYHEAHKQMIRAQEDPKAPIFDGRSWIDVTQLVWPMVFGGLIKDRSLKALIEFCKLPSYSGAGRADEDVTFLSRVYWSVMRKYNTALHIEDFATEVGGERLAAFRQLFGI